MYPGVASTGSIDPTIEASQNIYGQSFICLSLNGANLDKVASGLLITQPTAYFSNFKNAKFPNLQNLGNNVEA